MADEVQKTTEEQALEAGISMAPPPAVNTEESQGERPEGLPEGFDSWEAFGKAQLEARAAEEGKDGEEGSSSTEETQEAGGEELAPELQAEIDKLPEALRTDATPLFVEFAERGELSQESREKAKAMFNVTDEMLDLYMNAAQGEITSAHDQAWAPVFEAAGGKDIYMEFDAWATGEGGMTEVEQAEFNERLNKGGEEQAKVIAEAIELWKAQGNGPAPRDITRMQSGAAQEGADVYSSQAEVTKDMNRPEYAKDEAFRAKVAAKLGRSNL